MFWRKTREIAKLNKIIDENEETIDELEKQNLQHTYYISDLEKKLSRALAENKKLTNAMKEYGDLKIKEIGIPYHIEKMNCDLYSKNKYGGGRCQRVVQVTKTIPEITVSYIEEVDENE